MNQSSLLGKLFVKPVNLLLIYYIHWMNEYFLCFYRYFLFSNFLFLTFNIFFQYQTNPSLRLTNHFHKRMQHRILNNSDSILLAQIYQESFLSSYRQYVLFVSFENLSSRINVFILFFVLIKRILFHQKGRNQSKMFLPSQNRPQNHERQVLSLVILADQRTLVEQRPTTIAFQNIHKTRLLNYILFPVSSHLL